MYILKKYFLFKYTYKINMLVVIKTPCSARMYL